MRCGMFTTNSGEIVIVHDKEITAPLLWIEYDTSEDTFALIYEDGRSQALGWDIPANIKTDLTHGSEVTLAHLKDKQIVATQTLTFICKNT